MVVEPLRRAFDNNNLRPTEDLGIIGYRRDHFQDAIHGCCDQESHPITSGNAIKPETRLVLANIDHCNAIGVAQ